MIEYLRCNKCSYEDSNLKFIIHTEDNISNTKIIECPKCQSVNDVTIINSIDSLLLALGCYKVNDIFDVWHHPDFRFDFKLENIKDTNKLLEKFWQIFSTRGYENCQRDMKSVLGLNKK